MSTPNISIHINGVFKVEPTIDTPFSPRLRIDILEIQRSRVAPASRFSSIGIDTDFKAHIMDLLCGPIDTVGKLGEFWHYPVGIWISSRLHRPAIINLKNSR